MPLKTSDFHYDLPPELIAQAPLPERSASRLLHVPPGGAAFADMHVRDLPTLLRAGDLLVFNDTKVIPARLFGAKATGGRVIAVGTTVVRALESALVDGELRPFAGDTSIFIFPGYRIRSIDALMTKFHLPESTLLMLVSAFAGKQRMFAAYEHAVRQRYRFFSYGDAMLLWPEDAGV